LLLSLNIFLNINFFSRRWQKYCHLLNNVKLSRFFLSRNYLWGVFSPSPDGSGILLFRFFSGQKIKGTAGKAPKKSSKVKKQNLIEF